VLKHAQLLVIINFGTPITMEDNHLEILHPLVAGQNQQLNNSKAQQHSVEQALIKIIILDKS
jgi:hypothetical protein